MDLVALHGWKRSLLRNVTFHLTVSIVSWFFLLGRGYHLGGWFSVVHVSIVVHLIMVRVGWFHHGVLIHPKVVARIIEVVVGLLLPIRIYTTLVGGWCICAVTHRGLAGVERVVAHDVGHLHSLLLVSQHLLLILPHIQQITLYLY